MDIIGRSLPRSKRWKVRSCWMWIRESYQQDRCDLRGRTDAVVEAAFPCHQKAGELIDMRKHSGEHRIGATDVCPFVPVANVLWKIASTCAKALGERVGKELGIPVYLYDPNAASAEHRRNLASAFGRI